MTPASHPAPWRFAALAALTSALWLAGCAAQQHNGDGLRLLREGKTAEGLASLRKASDMEPNNARYRIDYLAQRELASQAVLSRADEARLLALDDIDWIESAGNYLCIRTGNETLILRETLTKMETRLDPKRFARIHRSRIVNLSRVAKLLPLYNGDHTVVLKDSTELGLSRTYRDALYRALGIEH